MARWPELRSLDDTGALAAVMLRVIRGCGVDAGGIVAGVVLGAFVCVLTSGAGCGLVGSFPGAGA